MQADGLIPYVEQEKQILKIWHKAFDELSFEDQFKYFIKGSTTPALQRVRDRSGDFLSEEARHGEIHPDAAPAAPVCDVKKLPRFSKGH